MTFPINRCIHKDPVTVDDTAGGTDLVTDAEIARYGVNTVHLEGGAEDVRIIFNGDGTFANSPFLLPAGEFRSIVHTAGPLKAICDTGLSSNVRVALGYGP